MINPAPTRGPLAYLSRLCSDWGGVLALLPEQEFHALDCQEPGISRAPDGWHAVDLHGRRVIAEAGHACPGCVIHEMGHLFLVEAEPVRYPDEWPWFGWEVALARRARCYLTWSESSRTYVIGGRSTNREWGDLKSPEKRRLIADRLAHARALGIVSGDNEPLCTRKRQDHG